MLFFVLSICMYWLQNFSNKRFCIVAGGTSIGSALVQNSVCCISASAVLFVFNGVCELPSGAFFFAALFGVTYLGTIFLLLCAFMRGSVGLSTLLCNIGSFVAAFYGVLRFKDSFTPLIAAGFICMLAAVILSVPKKERNESVGIKWFLFAFGSGLCSGIVSSVKREAVAKIAPENIGFFLAVGFLWAGVFALLSAVLFKNNRLDARRIIMRPRLLCLGAFAGIGTAGANLFQMRALLAVPSTIVYPMTSGVVVVTLWLASLLIYKETEAKPRNILSVILCVLAIILSNLKI